MCTNCGFAIKESDVFCPNCGKLRNSENLNFRLVFQRYKKFIIISLIISFAWPLIGEILNNSIIVYGNNTLPGNKLLILTSLVNIVNFIIFVIIIFLIYFYIQSSGLTLPKEFKSKFFIIEFFITGFGSTIGYGIGLVLTTPTELQIFSILSLPIDLILIFVNTGIYLAFLFILTLLLAKDGTETNKAFNNPINEIVIVGYMSGFILTILYYIFQYFSLNFIGNVMSIISLISISLQFISLIILALEIGLFYFVSKKRGLLLSKNKIIKNSLIIYVIILFGSISGLVVYNVLGILILSKVLIYNIDPILLISIATSSLGFALNLTVIFLSLIFILRK